MEIKNGYLILGRRDCNWCEKGSVKEYDEMICPKCDGTGRRTRGRCRNCFDNGMVKNYQSYSHVPCPRCHGQYENFEEENLTDRVEVPENMELRVIRSERNQTINEYLFAFGFMYSVTDYGRHERMTDEELIAKIREDSSFKKTQALNIARKEDLKICDYVGVYCNNNGYSLKPVWEE